MSKQKSNSPKILVLDIETSPIIAHVWDLWSDSGIGLSQVHQDWFILSWAAKWLGEPVGKMKQADQRNAKDMQDDSRLLKGIWKLLDEADIILTQNGKRFDEKKLNARFILNGFKPPSSYKHIDTCEIAKRKFGFTSNKLEYLTSKLNKKYKKLKHKEYPGHELWVECLARNPRAWKVMKRYNEYDVLALEELYQGIRAWDNSYNPNLYSISTDTVCTCGGKNFKLNGYAYTSVGKFQRHACKDCGAEVRDRKNLFSKAKSQTIKVRSK